jgi:hypothetical protein
MFETDVFQRLGRCRASSVDQSEIQVLVDAIVTRGAKRIAHWCVRTCEPPTRTRPSANVPRVPTTQRSTSMHRKHPAIGRSIRRSQVNS